MALSERPAGFTWDSKAGREVEKRLRAWAEHDAYGKGQGGEGNSFQGKPGDITASWTLAMDVDITLKEWGANRLENMIRHVYATGGSPGTVDDGRIDSAIEMFFPKEMGEYGWAFDRAKAKFVRMALFEFGRFMAERRGLR
jgi:hypothetical protein